MNFVLKIFQLAFFVIPLTIYTGAKDNFLIKETLFLILILGTFSLHFKFKSDRVLICIGAFLFVELLSLVNAKHPMLVFHTVVVHLCFGLVYLIAREFSFSEREKLLSAVLYSGLLAGLYGLLQYFGVDFFKWATDYGGRPSSCFGNPNFFAGYIVVLLPVAIEKSFATARGFKKFLWVMLSVSLAANLIFAKTRGAIIASFFSLLALFFLMKFYRNIKVTAILIVMGFVLGMFYFNRITGYISYNFNPRVKSVVERVFKWRTAFEMVKDHPLLGVGAGNLKVNFALYQARVRELAGFKVRSTSESNVHNEYFQIWAETGTLGLISFLLIFVFYFLSASRNQHGYIASVIAFLFFSLSNFPLRIVPTGALMFLFMGFSVPQSLVGIDTKNVYKFLKAGALIVYFLIVVKFAIIPFVADIVRVKGDIAEKTGDLNKAVFHYEKAIKLDYVHSERTAYDLGEVYRKLDMLDDAVRAYKISIDLRNYGEVYNCLANCYWLKGNRQQAIKNWEIAVNLGLPDENDQKIVLKNLESAKSLAKK